MKKFRVSIDGRYSYGALFACSVDAVIDALERGAIKVKVEPA